MNQANKFAPSAPFCFAALAMVLFATPGLVQQPETGTIAGTVRDNSGAAVSGAQVSLAGEGGLVFVAVVSTGADGHYSFTAVKAGSYRLAAKLPGSSKTGDSGVALTPGQEVVVDLTLAAQSDSVLGEAGYYEGAQLKPGDFTGSVDAGGYSAPGQAARTGRLLAGAVDLKSDPAGRAAKKTRAPVRVKNADFAEVEMELQQAVKVHPESFGANHNLGEFYIHVEKLAAAIPYLEKAYHLDPSHYVNAYDLALAELETQNYAAAQRQLHAMLERQDGAELHDLLAEVEEKSGNYVEAANEYERAAHLEPSEQHIFDWGVELLLHQTMEPALKVFRSGVERYPRSARLAIGLGVSLYARGSYDEAIKTFSGATDLNPSDPRPYLFLAKVYNVSTGEAPGATERLRRFAELEPRNAQALYYYALSLWKGMREQTRETDLPWIENLFSTAAKLDPRFADPHLQLGLLYAQRKDYPQAVREYREAIRLEPDLVDAHYRLAQAYVRAGEKERARGEFEIYGRLHNQQQAEAEKQRSEIRQFVYSLQDSSKP